MKEWWISESEFVQSRLNYFCTDCYRIKAKIHENLCQKMQRNKWIGIEFTLDNGNSTKKPNKEK